MVTAGGGPWPLFRWTETLFGDARHTIQYRDEFSSVLWVHTEVKKDSHVSTFVLCFVVLARGEESFRYLHRTDHLVDLGETLNDIISTSHQCRRAESENKIAFHKV